MRQSFREGAIISIFPPPDIVWDAAVVGAGPAGATTAAHLAKNGHRVLLLDKERFPREKACGDALIHDALACLDRLGIGGRVRERGCVSSIVSLYSPSRIRADIPGDFVTLKRIDLDAMIVEAAVRDGAKFFSGSVANIEPSGDGASLTVDGINHAVRARLCILAIGANVVPALRAGIAVASRANARAVRCYVESRARLDRLAVSFERHMLPGYAWIFPLGDGVYNVGCGEFLRDGEKKRLNLRQAFAKFAATFPAAREIMAQAVDVSPLKGAQLRCGFAGTESAMNGRIAVAGETAATTLPLLGEGVGKAMETGEALAVAAHRFLATGNERHLRDYQGFLERNIAPRLREYRLVERFMANPFLNDLALWRMNRSAFLRETVARIIREDAAPMSIFSPATLVRSFID